MYLFVYNFKCIIEVEAGHKVHFTELYGVDSWPKLLCATIIYSFGTNFVTFADKHEVLHIYQMGIRQKVLLQWWNNLTYEWWWQH